MDDDELTAVVECLGLPRDRIAGKKINGKTHYRERQDTYLRFEPYRPIFVRKVGEARPGRGSQMKLEGRFPIENPVYKVYRG